MAFGPSTVVYNIKQGILYFWILIFPTSKMGEVWTS